MNPISTLQGIAASRLTDPVERIGSPLAPSGRPADASLPPGAGSFADVLAETTRDPAVSLSSHVQRRMEQRQIQLGDDQLERLGKAMDLLAAKGGRQSLVMLDEVAYVVHIPSHTVVTAVGPNDRKEAVFTQIDSVAIA